MSKIKYTIPKPKKVKGEKGMIDEPYQSSFYLDISKEQLDALTVGEVTEVTIKGKIKMLEAREDEKKKKYELSIIPSVVIVEDGKNAMADLLDEDGE